MVTTLFPNYGKIHKEIHVRITDFGVIDQLRSLRQVHLDALVRVPGVVTRRTGVFPYLKHVKYDCVKCGTSIGPFAQSIDQETKNRVCPTCSSKVGEVFFFIFFFFSIAFTSTPSGSISGERRANHLSQLSAHHSAREPRLRACRSPASHQGSHSTWRSHRPRSAWRGD